MPDPVINATPGDPAANSYATEAEAQAYFDSRFPLPIVWGDGDVDASVLLVMATRLLEGYANSLKMLVTPANGVPAYYRIGRQWTGLPASTTQRLSWPRSGMLDVNGNAIPTTTVPQELKEAQSELAGQLSLADRTLDNDVIVQGITSIKAGSVALTFKNQIFPQVIPDACLALLLPSWLTDEGYEPAAGAIFEVVSRGSHWHGNGGRW